MVVNGPDLYRLGSGGGVLIETRGLTKTYVLGEETVHALAGVSFAVDKGEFVAVMGSSGSGKSTLMNVLGCLDTPTSGSYHLAGTAVESLDDDRLAEIRNREIGFVFQTFNLLSRMDALHNVALPLLYAGWEKKARLKRAEEVLEKVGLGHRLKHKPNEMSGGQRQRVAVARALVNAPSMILADEPTGNLDSTTSQEIMGLLVDLHDQGHTIVMVTHEPEIAAFAQRTITMKDGSISHDQRR